MLTSRFAAANLDRNAGGPEYAELVDALAADDKSRTDFLKACLSKLGLQVTSDETSTVPSLSTMHMSSLDPTDTAKTVQSWQEYITKDGDVEYFSDANDTFRLERPGVWSMDKLEESLPPVQRHESNQGMVDYNAVVKRLAVHDELPSAKATPYFNHNAYYANLRHYQAQSKEGASEFGSNLLYAEVITSTNTILEKNPKLLRSLPNGFTATATTQVAGRGRGSNVWVSPSGSLIFSTVVRHPVDKIQSSPIVFIQYLAAMAVVKGIKSYDRGYDKLPVKLKWPNDVCMFPRKENEKKKKKKKTDKIDALDPSDPSGKRYTKICGILVNSHFSSTDYVSVVGIGINATNSSPTTSLSALVSHFLPSRTASTDPITLEKLLARIVSTYEELYARFLRTGFDRTFEELYYDDWLHMHQVVTLEEEGGAKARIKGITRDYGLLLAEELTTAWDGSLRATGKVWQLQSDSNSFDFLKGLVKRKV